jgi:hypothetical protein
MVDPLASLAGAGARVLLVVALLVLLWAVVLWAL